VAERGDLADIPEQGPWEDEEDTFDDEEIPEEPPEP
jgi:hypothetical protein